MSRDRSAGVLVEDTRILLLHRRKGSDEYFVVPGGQVEEGETPEQACVREMREEVGLEVTVDELVREMPDGQRVQRFYRVTRTGGEVRLGDGPEALRNRPGNSYEPRWVPLSRLASLPVRPARVLPALLMLAWADSPTDPTVLADLAAVADQALAESPEAGA